MQEKRSKSRLVLYKANNQLIAVNSSLYLFPVADFDFDFPGTDHPSKLMQHQAQEASVCEDGYRFALYVRLINPGCVL